MAIIGTTDLGDGRLFVTVDHDPQSVATDAPINSLIDSLSTGLLYRKIDAGSTTNALPLTNLEAGGKLPLVQIPVIDDTVHGNRGGGILHPAATTGINGFMSAVDKTRFNQTKNLVVTGGGAVGYASESGTSWAAKRWFRFPGTNAAGIPILAKFVAGRTGTGTGECRIYDETNGNVIAAITGINIAALILWTDNTLASLPVGDAVFRLDLRVVGSATVGCAEASLIF